MYHLKIVLFLSFVSGCVQAQQKAIPNYIEKCSLKKDFKECVLRSANRAIPRIVQGDPEYNVPNMQPLVVPFVSLLNTPQLNVNLTNTQVYGLENTKMVDLNTQKDSQGISITPSFKIPNVTLSGEYSVTGNVLAFALNGRGMYSASLLNGLYKYPFTLKKVKLNGVDYYQARGKSMEFEFDDVIFDLGNIFSGDPEFGKQVNKLLIENWRTLLEEFRPTISEILTNIITSIVNKIAIQVPAKNVFLPE